VCKKGRQRYCIILKASKIFLEKEKTDKTSADLHNIFCSFIVLSQISVKTVSTKQINIQQ